MKSRILIALILIVLCGVSINVRGQQPSPAQDAEIERLKKEISSLEATPQPPDADLQAELHNSLKLDRLQLENLLLKKQNKLKDYLQGLESSHGAAEPSPAVRRLEDLAESKLQAIKNDLEQLETASNNEPAPLVSDTKTPANTKETTAAPAPKNDGRLAENTGRNSSSNAPSSNTAATTPPAEAIPDQLVLHDCNQVNLTPPQFTQYEVSICRLAQDIVDRKKNPAFNDPTSGIVLERDEGNVLPILFGKFAKDEKKGSFILEAEEARTDKQVGGGPANNGTTSLAVKGGVPSAFGWAVENGAAVASTSGTTITFRVNPVGAIQALSNQGYITGYREDENDPLRRFLRKTSLGLSFDANRGTTDTSQSATPNIFYWKKESAFSSFFPV
jgi:hypothetical protein